MSINLKFITERTSGISFKAKRRNKHNYIKVENSKINILPASVWKRFPASFFRERDLWQVQGRSWKSHCLVRCKSWLNITCLQCSPGSYASSVLSKKILCHYIGKQPVVLPLHTIRLPATTDHWLRPFENQYVLLRKNDLNIVAATTVF